MTSQQMPVAETSRGFPAFTIIFSVVFSIVYCLAIHFHWALFSYGPTTGEFGLFSRPATTGATMLWYGLVATSALVAAAAGIIVGSMCKRLWHGLAWLLPLGALIGISFLIAVVGD